jgi:hypothetical protein
VAVLKPAAKPSPELFASKAENGQKKKTKKNKDGCKRVGVVKRMEEEETNE